MDFLDRWFRLDENGTTVGTEVRAGVVTFMTMAYIIVVQPAVLVGAGMPMDAVMLATCLSSAVATLIMGLSANYPIALAPAMGHNFYFTFLVTSKQATWQEALGAVFISGSLFIVLSFFGFRERIVNAVPDTLKYAIAVGIGLLIALVGLRGAGLVVETPAADGWKLGEFDRTAVLALIGLAITGSLMAFKVRGAILLGLIASTIIGSIMGLVQLPGSPVAAPPWGALKETALQFDIAGAIGKGLFGVIFTFFILDLFDTIGTLIGVSQQAGLMKDGKLPRARRALFADASGTVVGAALGTSTVTSYIESAAGVSEGGRTGLASVVTAFLFIASIFFYPSVRAIAQGTLVDQTVVVEQKTNDDFLKTRAQLVPPEEAPRDLAMPKDSKLLITRKMPRNGVTAPALILIGCLIMASVAHIPWGDWSEALPAFLAIVMMPLTMNITEGIAFGFIAYSLLKVLLGRWRSVSPWVLVFAALFVVRYACMGLGVV
jgi:AGZA family xanthine/uracil permease-like MFS transporter